MIRAGDRVRVTYGSRREARVLRLEDHCPVDGSREISVVALLSDGSWEFVWNLEKL